jgi:hypothetical protein
MERYSNKRTLHRTSGGKFRKAKMSDAGLMGTCLTCHHLLVRFYDGDPNDQHPDPRRFRSRCYHCEPETETEKAARAEAEVSEPKFSISEFFKAQS